MSVFACSVVLLGVSLALFGASPGQAPLLAPVVLGAVGGGLTLLSLRARARAERADVSG